MNNDDHLTQAFQNLRFADEPPMASTTADDIHRGQCGLRRQRVMTLSPGVAMLAVVATGVAIALPGQDASQRTDVAGNPSVPLDPDFPKTSQLMLDALAEHLDPTREHLDLDAVDYHADISFEIDESPGPDPGSLDHLTVEAPWNGDGTGTVTAALSTPIEASMAPPADSPDYMRNTIADIIGPSFDPESWAQEEVLGVGGTVWTLKGAANTTKLAVIHVREDTSVAGMAVKAETTDGAEPGITVEQAVTFVTEPDLVVDPSEYIVAGTPTDDPDDQGDFSVPQEFQFPKTAQHLNDAARRHFGEDIPVADNPLFATARGYGSTDQSYGGTGGGIVDWTLTVPDSDDWGLVEISLLTPDFAAKYFASQPWRASAHDWIEHTIPDAIPGTDTNVWIADETQWDQEIAENMAFAIAYEQADGSMVLVDVYQGSGIDIEQAYDLVADPDLQIDPAEATDEYWRLVAEKHQEISTERPTAEADE